MSKFRVGFIGTGKRRERPGPMGYAMAYQHAEAYRKLPDCELVACADIVEENARAFAETFGITRIYTDYHEMLEKEQLDIVSICTWPHLHAPMVIDAARAGVKAIHCEKPMADTWGAAKRMVEECKKFGAKLTFNHQRRFGFPFRKAKALLEEGVIGDLLRIEIGFGNLYDYGSHTIDLANFFNNETPAEWVIAQIDYREERLIFGMHNENQAFALWRYRNGVYGLMATGAGTPLVNCHHRLVGTEGVIEIGPAGENMPVLRVRRFGKTEWEAIDCKGEGLHGPNYIDRAITNIVAALKEGRESELCAENALKATEIIFAAYESVRRRGRVDLPLTIDDNPLVDLINRGDLKPQPRQV